MAFDETNSSPAFAEGLCALARAFNERGIAYALIGGVAIGFRSRPQYTEDLDFVLNIPQAALAGLLKDLQARGFSFDMQRVIQQWTREHMVVLDYHGVRVDWLRPALPLYQHDVEQARAEPWLGMTMRIAAPEGLILTKLIASRAQDLLDIESLIAANYQTLDVAWITREWNTIADESDPRFQRFLELLRLQQEHLESANLAPESPLDDAARRASAPAK